MDTEKNNFEKEQYLFLKDMYYIEDTRHSNLTKKSEIYLTIFSLLIGGIFFKLKDIDEIFRYLPELYRIILYAVIFITMIFFSIAFFYLCSSLKIGGYEIVCDLDEYEKNFTTEKKETGIFLQKRSFDYLHSTNTNIRINNQKAEKIGKSLIFIIYSFFCVILFILLFILLKVKI